MNERNHAAAFYMETIILLIVFMSVILIITNVFTVSYSQSKKAEELTSAVCLAENAAEAFLASDDIDTLYKVLDEGNVQQQGTVLLCRYDPERTPDPDGAITVQISLEEENDYLRTEIAVSDSQSGEVIYELHTGKYVKEGR